MAKIIVYLGDQERNALLQPAQRELRLAHIQAALIIRQGMLPNLPPLSDSPSPFERQTGASS